MSGSVELDQLCEMEHTFVPHFIETELIDLMRTYGAVLDDDDNLSLEITETQRRLSLEPSPADDATAAPRRRLSQRDSVRRQSLRTAARPAQFSLLSDAVPPPQVQQFTLPPRAAQLPLHQQRYIQRLTHHPLTLAHAHPHHRRRRPPPLQSRQCALLFVDIAGFTAITERLATHSNGAERLSYEVGARTLPEFGF
jgi:hypothetical protein